MNFDSHVQFVNREMEVTGRAKILLVDDREENLMSLEALLNSDAYEFVRATSGRQALKHLMHDSDFALILMDVLMPEMDGFETASLIYEREKLRNIPIIFLTAMNIEENIYKGYQAGAVDYMSKPIIPDLLRAKVGAFVELSLKTKKLVTQEQQLRTINMQLEKEITEHKQSEEKIKLLNNDLAAKLAELESLDAFTYSVSHDLRSPLNGISGLVRVLTTRHKEGLNEEAHTILNMILTSVDNMENLISSLLLFSRHATAALSREHVEMRELVNEVMTEVATHTPGENVKFIINDMPAANCDPNMIKQVWINFITNAIKYSQKQPEPLVEIGAFDKEGETVYYVKDNGIGFNMKSYDKLFNIFKRLPEAKDFEGTGVGLAIVKRIINCHGGKVWAEATPGEGASFYFTIQ
jgi:two-component system, sensor histidine kinase and response regulator